MKSRESILVYRQKIREGKIYRRRRKVPKRDTSRTISDFKSGGIIPKYYSPFLRHFHAKGYIDSQYVSKIIKIPNSFVFTTNYDECIIVFKSILSSFLLGYGKIILDFSRCKKSSVSGFALLEIILFYLEDYKIRFNKNRYFKCEKKLTIVHSKKDSKTNKYIHTFLGVALPAKDNDGSQFLKFDMRRGCHTTYSHNEKARICTELVRFLEESSHKVGVSLKPKGRSNLEKLIGEVLGNAEDHSAEKSFWHVLGVSFLEKQSGTDVVELNLCIANTGFSMYEGFEETKHQNIENYMKCQQLYDEHSQKFTAKHNFERENLFTLYLLNDGISRLKFQDSSRGNGTTRFLQAFITLGLFGQQNKKFNSQLTIASGHTTLKCDNAVGPYKNGTALCLSLNLDKDIRELPSPDYLKYYKSYFPGTFFEIQIFLNEEFFKQKLAINNEDN